MTLRDLHADFSWVVVATNAAVGLWALVAHRWERWRSPWLWRATLGAELTIVVQVCLGVALVAIDDFEVAQFHAFYGFVALATIGIVYSYRQQVEPHLFLLYGLGGLFLMGLALRAISISPIPVP
ncbi:MAG: hypothetical protein ABL966_11560 [Acidimicrobiales bacterium]